MRLICMREVGKNYHSSHCREYSKVLRETMAKIMFNYGTIALFLKKVWNFIEILPLFQKNKMLTRKSKKKHHSI